MADIPKTFFHDPDEKVMAVLGQGYVAGIISAGGFSKSVMVLTDRRLYTSGKVFGKGSNNVISSVKGKQVVDVRNISSTGFQEVSKTELLWKGIITLPLFGMGIIFLVLYFLSRTRYFFVEYSGGAVGTNCKWHSPSELEEFQRKLFEVKDKIAYKQSTRREYW